MSKGKGRARADPSGEQKNLKKFAKPLDKTTKVWYNKYETGEGKPHKPERITTMKKATMNSILSLIASIDSPEAEAVRAELNAELNKGAEEKARNAELYDSAKSIVMDELSNTPVTISELWDALADKLTEVGFTKGKLQYAVTRLWKDEIVRTEGKVNTYSKA